MIYIELPNQEISTQLSILLYRLFSPRNGVTNKIFNSIKHPTKDSVIACLDLSKDFPNYFCEDTEEIFTEIDSLLGNSINPEQLSQVGNCLRTQKRVSFNDIIPQALLSQSLNKKQVKSLGYFPEPN